MSAIKRRLCKIVKNAINAGKTANEKGKARVAGEEDKGTNGAESAAAKAAANAARVTRGGQKLVDF